MPRWGGWGNQQRTTPPPQTTQPAIAPAAQAAPTNVQLACVQAANARIGGPPGSITPTTSSLIRQDTFRVDLNTASGPVICLADRGGNILSIERAAPQQRPSSAQNPRLL